MAVEDIVQFQQHNKRPVSTASSPQGVDGKRHLAQSVNIFYRILCPFNRTGSVIGKGGDVIQQLRNETTAKIKIEDAVPSCDERVITIFSNSSATDGEWVAATEALFKVFIKVVQGDGDFVVGPVLFRMLVDSRQIGAILGRAGSVISELRKESGAQIRVMGKQDLPICAFPTEELVQIAGDQNKVNAALDLITKQLRNAPPRASPAVLAMLHMPADLYSLHAVATGLLPNHFGPLLPPQSPVRQGNINGAEVHFRLLVPAQRIGSIIGRGGEVIKRIRMETEARVKVQDITNSADDRVVTITSYDDPLLDYSPAVDALLRCAACLVCDDASPPQQRSVRLLVQSPQVGAVLGKGGAIITQLRQESKAHIKIMAADQQQLNVKLLDNDELVQIEGNQSSCLHAVQAIATLLRGWQVRHFIKMCNSPQSLAATPMSMNGNSHFGTASVASSSPPAPSRGMPDTTFQDLQTTAGLLQLQHELETLQQLHLPAILPQLVPPLNRIADPSSANLMESVKLTVPELQIGAILGKGGPNVSHIRQVMQREEDLSLLGFNSF